MSNEEDVFLSEVFDLIHCAVCNGNDGEVGDAVDLAEEALDVVRQRIVAVGLTIEEDEDGNIEVVRKVQ